MTSSRLDWYQDGEHFFASTLALLADDDFAAPTLLPEWSRQRLLAHVALNADALVNLLTWARTGVETPMYASAEAREAGMLVFQGRPAGEVRAAVLTASARLADSVAAMPEQAWAAQVRTAQGRTVPASQVLWMRCREVWVHAVDLAAGPGFEQLPEAVLVALIDDVFAMWSGRDAVPAIAVLSDDAPTHPGWGPGPIEVRGAVADLTGWLTGRAGPSLLSVDAAVPDLPRWL